MSRTKKGSKSPGYDFWSRRPPGGGCAGSGPEAKKITHKAERAEKKRVILKEKKEITKE